MEQANYPLWTTKSRIQEYIEVDDNDDIWRNVTASTETQWKSAETRNESIRYTRKTVKAGEGEKMTTVWPAQLVTEAAFGLHSCVSEANLGVVFQMP